MNFYSVDVFIINFYKLNLLNLIKIKFIKDPLNFNFIYVCNEYIIIKKNFFSFEVKIIFCQISLDIQKTKF